MSTPAPTANAPASTGSFFSSLFGSSKKPTNAATPPAPGTAVGGKRRASRVNRHRSRKNRKNRSRSRRNRK